MTLNSDAKFKEKLTCGFKYDIRNLVNFHPATQKSENFTLMDYFCPKYMRFELKKYRGFIYPSKTPGGVEKAMICFFKIQSKNMKMTCNISLFSFGMIAKSLNVMALQFCK